ncbi:MAG: iron ABC transporter permease, partial [Rhodospirillales bacterium]|nr:iron ABC transporter permease [Acetobacter sp.]
MSTALALFLRWRRGHAWIVGAALLISLMTLLPLGFILFVAWQSGWQTIVAMVLRPRVGELLINTLLLVGCTVPLCAILAIALAWLTERGDMPTAHLWSGLAVAPLAVPAFVQSYAWITLFPSLHGLFAAVLVSVISYTPFLYLPIAATLRRLDPALEDVATSLGQNPWQVFRRVVLPQLRLALCGGALLIALHLLAEYGLFAMIRFDTFTTAIIDQYRSTFNGPAANMLAGVLVICCLSLLALDAWLRGDQRYARLGSGAPRSMHRCRLHWVR